MHKLLFIELIVDGYNRLALSDTKYFKITPKNIHLILGTNGSGKSSLLELMTPLPPNRKDFKEGGYKDITFKYDTDMYRFYSQDNKHTVYKNGEVVLDNVGITMVVDLCKECFNITPLLHKFMLGKVNITTMSLQARKEFITNISHIDYDYANKVYNNLKKKLRDEQAISKHIHNKILALKSYILNEDDILKLKKRKEDIDNALTILYKYKTPKVNKQDIEYSNYKTLISSTNTLLTYCKENNLLNNSDKLKNDLAVLKNKKVETLKQRDDVSATLFEMSKLLDSNTLEKELSTLTKTITDLTTNRLLPTSKEEYGKLINNIRNHNTDVTTLFNTLLGKLYDIKDYTIQDLIDSNNSYIDKVDNYNKRIEILSSKVNTIVEKQKDYMAISNSLVCTHCGTPIINDKLLKTLDKDKVLATDYNNELAKLKTELSNLKRDNTSTDNLKLYNDSIEILKSVKLYSYVIGKDSILDMYNIVDRLYVDSQTSQTLLDAIDRKKTILEVSDNLLDEKKYKQLELEYDGINKQLATIDDEIRDVNTMLDKLSKLSSNISEINRLLQLNQQHRKTSLIDVRNDAIDLLLENLKVERIELNIQLDKYNHSINEESTLNIELEKSLRDIRLLEVMIAELSPSTGLIADSIKSFIVKYVNEVNDIINAVWSYRLDVMPYDTDDLDKGITYRFPVKTEDNENSDDIANTSESMREIISLAFRLVSLKYLGMGLYPLMIDEFGRSMDEVHLIKSYDMLEEIVEENDIQMFIIAHIKTAYNRFTNAGISIVSNLNLEEI